MYKLSWGLKCDKFQRSFVLVPDVHTLYDIYFVMTSYGGGDGCTPVDIEVTDLSGNKVDMYAGLADAAGRGTVRGSLC